MQERFETFADEHPGGRSLQTNVYKPVPPLGTATRLRVWATSMEAREIFSEISLRAGETRNSRIGLVLKSPSLSFPVTEIAKSPGLEGVQAMTEALELRHPVGRPCHWKVYPPEPPMGTSQMDIV
ncbi:MAG TPA: hypothetical protein VFG07_06210 [Thermoplasmata archaeon]|nr:hypothetical protein [Thermoplasmata archaeon]